MTVKELRALLAEAEEDWEVKVGTDDAFLPVLSADVGEATSDVMLYTGNTHIPY